MRQQRPLVAFISELVGNIPTVLIQRVMVHLNAMMKKIERILSTLTIFLTKHTDTMSVFFGYCNVETFPYCRTRVLRLIEGTFNANRLSCISSANDERFAKKINFSSKNLEIKRDFTRVM